LAWPFTFKTRKDAELSIRRTQDRVSTDTIIYSVELKRSNLHTAIRLPKRVAYQGAIVISDVIVGDVRDCLIKKNKTGFMAEPM
jgi:hypothetical protein